VLLGGEKAVFDNTTYDLIMQLTQEHKTLWRIKNNYKKDAAACKECREFWEDLEKQCEANIARLEELVMKHMPQRILA
jgi:hypothetical protein